MGVWVPWGPFIYYVITFLGFLAPPSPLRQHVFSTKNQQKLAFSDPPSPSTSADVIYEWSLSSLVYREQPINTLLLWLAVNLELC